MSESDVVSSDFAIFTMVESLGSVRHLLFFVRFCLDIPLRREISFHEMSFSFAFHGSALDIVHAESVLLFSFGN